MRNSYPRKANNVCRDLIVRAGQLVSFDAVVAPGLKVAVPAILAAASIAALAS